MKSQVQTEDCTAPRLLRRLQAAQFLNVSPRTLDYWRAKAGLPFVKIGAVVRFIPEDLERFIKSRSVGN